MTTKTITTFCIWSLLALCCVMQAKAQVYYLHSEQDNVKWYVMPCGEDKAKDLVALSSATTVMPSDAVEAVVPGTVFTSYVKAGHEKDPNFGDNIHRVDREKYDRSFWYRTEFSIPSDFSDKEMIWLHFQGVNRKAEIYLNGCLLGILDGFMHRGHFDISKIIQEKNILLVKVDIPQKPLANQGSPNYLSSGGWDWMPYVPGLNSGITDKVWLSASGVTTLIDPWVRSNLPTLAKAELSVELDVKNHDSKENKSIIRGRIMPGNVEFEQELTLSAGESKHVKFDKRYFPQLIIGSPRLWWPNGYGEPNLYTCRIEIETDGKISESKEVRFGIRKYTYDKEGGVFHIHINGVPIFVKGANWGMSEYMLRCRDKEYKTKIQLHQEMNFNMIRNWLGSVTDEEFYDYCDEYGIMVWDDFWINSNPNLPYDLNVFNNNVIEKIKRVRNHPCIAVWCGDNEATPQPPLAGWMAENIRTFDGGDRYFQACSNDGGLSGSGYWGAFDQRYYFTNYPDPSSGGDNKRGWGFRTEIGTAVVPTFESFKKFMPEENWWPIDEMWNKHYFGSNASNALPDKYIQMITEGFGEASGVEDFCRKAQLVNYTSNKALYEGWLDHIWDDASGVMTWMGQSAYPSMVWQTYDYYYDLTGAYWGCRQACEPLHIYWHPVTDEVKVVNTTANDYKGLTAEAVVYNLDGCPVKRYTQSATVNSVSNTSATCFVLGFNKERSNLSLGKPVVASSTLYGSPADVADGRDDTRWAADKADNEWIYIDLENRQSVGGVRLNWEAAYGKAYKIQVSDDAEKWREIYKTYEGHEGIEEIIFPEVEARYVRMFGIELGWWYGYSLWSMDVLSGVQASEGLDDVHFIRLTLRDDNGNVIDENTYWRGNDRKDFTALNSLLPVKLSTSSRLSRSEEGKAVITATVSLPKSAPNVAFFVHVQAHRKSDGERILPAVMSDNYITLMPGEKKEISIEFEENLLQGGGYELEVSAYNNR